MVANVNGPQFSGGANIAIKCPSHTYEQMLAFYRDTLGLPLIEEEAEGAFSNSVRIGSGSIGCRI